MSTSTHGTGRSLRSIAPVALSCLEATCRGDVTLESRDSVDGPRLHSEDQEKKRLRIGKKRHYHEVDKDEDGEVMYLWKDLPKESLHFNA